MKKLLILLLVLIALPAEASRGFGTTYGAGTTDKILTGTTAAFPAQHTYAYRLWRHGSGGGGFGRIYAQASSADNFNTTVTQHTEIWSTTAGGWTWNQGSADVWQSYVVTYDGSSTANDPIVYQNGTSIAVTRATAPVGSYTGDATALYIGNRSDGTRNWDGMICEFALWTGILTANEATAYANGMSPLKIRPGSLVFYFPLYGTQSGEQDWGPSHFTQTLTGTLKQNHASIQPFPFQRNQAP